MRSSYLIIVICWVFAIAGCGEGDVENIPASTEGAEPPATVPLVDPADLVLFNGSIYTVSPEQPWVEAVAIDDGRYVFIGASSDTGQYIGEGTEVIDLAGRFAMPGINDGHVHVSYGGEEIMFHCKFPFTATPEEIGQTLADCVSRIDGEWIIGGQWTSSFFENFEIESPREVLDEYSGDKAVFFNDDSLHNGWANSRALELASVTHDTPDPDGGSVERDAEGVPNGVLLERATELVERVIPPFTPEQYQQAIRAGLETMASPGVTGVKEANGRDTGVAAFQAVDRQGGSSAHVATSLQTPTGHRTEPLDVAEFIEKRDRYRSENVHTEYIKMFLDGVPTVARTAAMLAPYVDDPNFEEGFTGPLHIDPDILAAEVAAFDRAGFTVKIHTTGDRAVRVALDAIEAARQANGPSGLRHELGHAGYIDPEDIPRFAALNAVADFSPYIWHPSPIINSVLTALGPERGEQYFPTRSLIDAEAPMLVGSDWPAAVPSANPWIGIEALVTRADPYGKTPGTLWLEEAITLEEALVLFTINGARALRLDGVTGSIEPGKYADLIVLDRNLFEVPITDVGETTVEMTFFKGNIVYQAE